MELIAALSILTVSLLGVAALLSQSFAVSRIISNDAVATYLASEGIELAKNLIDHDVYAHLAGNGAGWNSCFGTGGHFQFDYTRTNCTNLPAYNSASYLYFNPATNLYSYNTPGSVATNFTRDIQIIPYTNEIVVRSTVWWSASRSVTVEDHFYNWHP